MDTLNQPQPARQPQPQPLQPQMAGITKSLERSFRLHVGQNAAIRDAFAELAFELALARDFDQPAVQPGSQPALVGQPVAQPGSQPALVDQPV